MNSTAGVKFVGKCQTQKVIIDVHHHIAPDVFLQQHDNDDKKKRNSSLPPIFPGAMLMDANTPHISIQSDLNFMENTGITFALTSFTAEESIYHQPIEDEVKYLQDCNKFQWILSTNTLTSSAPF
jgi:hypothetical protein